MYTYRHSPHLLTTSDLPIPLRLCAWSSLTACLPVLRSIYLFYRYQNLTYGANVSLNPFFYGNYLGPTKAKEPVKRSKDQSYQCDSISALSNLHASHWEEMHTYRLEWEPGEGGFLRWYIDGEFKFGIEEESLSAAMATQVPREPSYLIFNTAISTSWGFPEPPPGCDKYDCKVADGTCGMNPGFCHSLPATFLIDHVRVYQYTERLRERDSNSSDISIASESSRKSSENNRKHRSEEETESVGRGRIPAFHHTLSCNPRAYPTKKYIQANENKYRNLEDPHPLKPVLNGSGLCGRRGKGMGGMEEQGGQCGEGRCYRGACVCPADWTGPYCLVPAYRNPFPDWDYEQHWVPPLSAPVVPAALALLGTVLLLVFAGGVVVVAKAREKTKLR